MKEFIIYILEQFVTKPEMVKVEEIEQDGFLIFNIEVDEEDMGLVIGKNGKTIRSIRSLVRAKAIKDGVRIRVELKDDNRSAEKDSEEESTADEN